MRRTHSKGLQFIVDTNEFGLELCSEAFEETVTSEEAQSLFDQAASKFQEVAALAFFNWRNVHMCAARKRIPLDESAAKDVMATLLQDQLKFQGYKQGLLGSNDARKKDNEFSFFDNSS